jgi:hypothetical protein
MMRSAIIPVRAVGANRRGYSFGSALVGAAKADKGQAGAHYDVWVQQQGHWKVASVQLTTTAAAS